MTISFLKSERLTCFAKAIVSGLFIDCIYWRDFFPPVALPFPLLRCCCFAFAWRQICTLEKIAFNTLPAGITMLCTENVDRDVANVVNYADRCYDFSPLYLFSPHSPEVCLYRK